MEKLFRYINNKITRNVFRLNKSYIRRKSNSAKDKQAYLILRATKEDHVSILSLMHKAYYPEEPTCFAVGIKPNPVLDSIALKGLAEGLTIMARCKYTGDIVAACINETSNPWDPDMKDRLACSVQCQKAKHLLHFYAYMQKVPNIWERYDVQKVFEMSYLFVKRDDRGNNLGIILMKHSRDLAVNCGYPLIRVDATSHYTSTLCEKMKMKKIYEIPYCAYVDVNHQQIFKPPPPHLAVKIYVDDAPHVPLSKKQ